MVRINKKQTKLSARVPRAGKGNQVLGPVSSISTAPVAIGNSIQGSSPVVEYIDDGCRVRGRDFAFEIGSSVAAATGWTLVGGLPLTPCAMPSTSLKSYCQMFSLFKFNALAVHYITSSPTSQAGDVMVYYEKDRTGPMLDNTSSSFLPTVLSDAHTVLGPQWTNHTAIIHPDKEFKSTNYGMNPDLNEETNGSIFLFSKTNAANSPGYILIDYDITFKFHQSNPRAGLLPVTRAQWTQTCLRESGAVWVSGTTVPAPALISGVTIAGTASAIPTGTTTGDIFKVVFDITNSTVSGTNPAWSNATASTLLRYKTLTTNASILLDDGFTCYLVVNDNSTGGVTLYPSLTNALSATNPFVAGTTATVTYAVCCYVSLVGSQRPQFDQTNY